jgi:hypothetical protein
VAGPVSSKSRIPAIYLMLPKALPDHLANLLLRPYNPAPLSGPEIMSVKNGSMKTALRHRVYLPYLWLSALGMTLGCHALRLEQPSPDKLPPPTAKLPAPPSKYSFRVSQYQFLSDFEVKHDLPIFRELANLRDQVYKELQLQSADSIVQVYIFEDRDKYENFMRGRYPDLPKRRAFFVAQPRSVGGAEDLLVYTYWGDRIQEDLRHELTHALLHSVLRDVPLWLDEGLAEYFEVPPDWKGVNYQHLNQIRRVNTGGGFKPDLARLEQMVQVQQMTPAEYREAWAWVHLMLRGRADAKAVLTEYLQTLRSNPNPGPIGPRLTAVYPNPETTLIDHVAQLEATNLNPPEEPGSPRIQ